MVHHNDPEVPIHVSASPIVGEWFWQSTGSAAGEIPWIWNSDATIDIIFIHPEQTPEPVFFDLISMDSWNLYLSPKPRKLRRPWTRILEKIKSETCLRVKDHLKPKIDSHYRKHHRINHNLHRRFN